MLEDGGSPPIIRLECQGSRVTAKMLRLADLLAGLSRLADLGFGLEAGTALRAAALATTLGRSLDLADEDVRAGLYMALLYHVGCVGYAREAARISGDELVWNAAVESTDVADPWDVLATFLPTIVRGRPLGEQTRLVFATLTRGRRFAVEYATVACEVGRDAARRLALPEEVQRSIYHSYESWDGGGVPDGRSGDDVPLGARLAVPSSVAAHLDTLGEADRLWMLFGRERAPASIPSSPSTSRTGPATCWRS